MPARRCAGLDRQLAVTPGQLQKACREFWVGSFRSALNVFGSEAKIGLSFVVEITLGLPSFAGGSSLRGSLLETPEVSPLVCESLWKAMADERAEQINSL